MPRMFVRQTSLAFLFSKQKSQFLNNVLSQTNRRAGSLVLYKPEYQPSVTAMVRSTVVFGQRLLMVKFSKNESEGC